MHISANVLPISPECWRKSLKCAQSSGVDLMKKWRVMNREAICLQLADKINHLKIMIK